MVYEADTSGVRDKQQEIDDIKREEQLAALQKEIDLLEQQQDEIDGFIDNLNNRQNEIDELIDSTNEKYESLITSTEEKYEALIDSANEYYDSQIESTTAYYDNLIDSTTVYYDNLIASTQAHWDGLIGNLEQYQTHWEELAGLVEQAEIEAKLQQLGTSSQEILKAIAEGDTQLLENFKGSYLSILNDLYAGNDQMLATIGETIGVSMEQIGSYLEQTQPYIDSLQQLDLTTTNEALAATSDGFKQLTEDISSSTNAINGSAGVSASGNSEGEEGSTQGSAQKTGGGGLVQAWDEGSAGMIENAAEVSNSFAGEDETSINTSIDTVEGNIGTPGEGNGNGKSKGKAGKGDSETLTGVSDAYTEHATGEEGFPMVSETLAGEDETSLNSSIDQVEENIGSTGKGVSNKSGENTLSGTTQGYVEYSTSDEGVPAVTEKFDELNEVILDFKKYLEEVKDILEELSSQTYEIKVNVTSSGSTSYLPSFGGHAEGVKNLKESEIAWTQEKGAEMIVSPTRNAILTPLEKGDSVINDKLTDNLFKWGTIDPDKFRVKHDYSVDFKNLPINTKNSDATPNLTIDNVNFSCTGVTGEQVMKQIESNFKGLFLNAYQQATTKK